LARIIDGYHRHLKLLADFWVGLYGAVTIPMVKSSVATAD
jgi:hypothetical protein